jgi:uncharacterized protein YkwD
MYRKNIIINIVLVQIMLGTLFAPTTVTAQTVTNEIPEIKLTRELETDPPPPTPPNTDNPYFQVEGAGAIGGHTIVRNIIGGPPEPPEEYALERNTASEPVPNKAGGQNSIASRVPKFSWSHGCSPTSAAMIAGYYDRTYFSNIYTGPTNNGVVPLDNTSWGTWTDSYGEVGAQMPLSATRQGLDGRSTKGHVDDYWIGFGNTEADPFVIGGWPEHAYGDSLGDYMKTSQTTNYGNADGETTFYTWQTSGDPLTCSQMEGYDIHQIDGTYGMKLFYEARGYTVKDCYSQRTDVSGSFSFEDFKAEIDAGNPVMIQLDGHTVVGVGYDEINGNRAFIHDTWDHDLHYMDWGGSYAGFDMYAVSIVHLEMEPASPGILNDDDPGIVYSEGWQTDTDPSYYNGDIHYSTTFIDEALFIFYGTQFKVIYTGAPENTSMFVAVDGNYEGYFSQYSESVEPQSVWESNLYPEGIHSVRLDAGATGSSINIDAIEVTPPGAGTYEEDTPYMVYDGSWHSWNDANASGGAFVYTNAPGASATMSFTGRKVTLVFNEYTNRGNIEVVIDGGDPILVDQYSSTLSYQNQWSSPNMDEGTHTIELRHPGGDHFVNIDALIISSPEAIPPAAVALNAATGSGTGQVDLSWNAPGDDGNVGRAASYSVRYADSEITTEGEWAAATDVEGEPIPNYAGMAQSMIVSGLTPGQTYYFALRTEDEVPNLSDLSNSPSATAQAPVPVGVGRYEEDDVNIAYAGNWTPWNDANASGGGLVFTNEPGASASLTFTGRQVTLVFNSYVNRGDIAVSIDGGDPTLVSQYSSSLSYQDEWSSPVLASGTHTVEFSHPGGSHYIDIDAIVISSPESLPPASVTLNAATGSGTGQVDLSWNAPGDDGNTGTATAYIVRYADSEITNEGEWAAATDVEGEPVPAAAGTAQSMIVSGLNPEQTYYFVLRTEDEVPNLSGLSNSPSAEAKTSVPVGVGRYEEDDVNITYSGTWHSWDDANASGGGLVYTNDPGASATLTFNGRQIKLVFNSYVNRGDVEVVIDGGAPILFSQYNSSLSYLNEWASPILAQGTHTVTFSHPGGSHYIDIDALIVPDIDPSAPVLYQETDPAISYTGNWSSWSDSNNSGGAMVYTNEDGASAELTYFGRQVKLIYNSYVNRGEIAVSIDGGAPVMVNQYGSSLSYLDEWASPVLTEGTHTITLTHPGGTHYIDIDALEVSSPETDTVAPSAVNLNAATGSGTGEVDLSWNAPGDDDDAGTASEYVVRYADSEIVTEGDWSAATDVEGEPVPAAAGTAQSMTVSGLTPEQTYYFALRTKDDFANLSGPSNSPSAAAQAYIPPGAGTYEEDDASITYSGTWHSWSDVNASGGAIVYTNEDGASATMTFSGRQVKLIYNSYVNRGEIAVIIDGGAPVMVDQYSASLSYLDEWYSPELSDGTHTIQFSHPGGSHYIDLDAVEVLAEAIAYNIPSDCNARINPAYDAEVLALVNQERTSRGLSALTLQSQLDTAANNHSVDMVCNDFFSHTGSDGSSPSSRATALGYPSTFVGENIYYGSGSYDSPQQTVASWMNSDGHRANILNTDYTEIGIGYVHSGSNGAGYFTADFGKP